MFTPMRPSRLPTKSPSEPPSKSTASASASADIPSTRESIWRSQGTSSGFDGANVKPQLPVMSVVTPCHDAGEAVGSQCSCAS